MMVKAKKVENTRRESGSVKRPPILTPDILNEQNKKALRNDPNIYGEEEALTAGTFTKAPRTVRKSKGEEVSFIIYYLLVTENQRLKLLSWMGSKLAANVPKPSLGDIHKLSLRLAKIPQDCGVVGDKG